jgi:hypothetical protein
VAAQEAAAVHGGAVARPAAAGINNRRGQISAKYG